MINESLKASGTLSIVLRGPDGSIKEDRTIPNLIVTVGKTFIAGRVAATGSAPTHMTHMEVGTGATAPAAGDTALQTVIAGSRVALSTAGGTSASNVVTYAANFPAGTGTGAITEAGIFNAASAGTMLCRTTFSVVNKAAADSLTITWTVTIN